MRHQKIVAAMMLATIFCVGTFFKECLHRDSNPDLWFRGPLCYPLHHGDL